MKTYEIVLNPTRYIDDDSDIVIWIRTKRDDITINLTEDAQKEGYIHEINLDEDVVGIDIIIK